MPDITMCLNVTCPARTMCGRHKAGGATPTSERQSVTIFVPNGRSGQCAAFLPANLPQRAHRYIDDILEKTG